MKIDEIVLEKYTPNPLNVKIIASLNKIIRACNAHDDAIAELDITVCGNCEDIDKQAAALSKLTERVTALEQMHGEYSLPDGGTEILHVKYHKPSVAESDEPIDLSKEILSVPMYDADGKFAGYTCSDGVFRTGPEPILSQLGTDNDLSDYADDIDICPSCGTALGYKSDLSPDCQLSDGGDSQGQAAENGTQETTRTDHTIHVPNDLTRRTMEETDRGEDIVRFDSVEALMDDLNDAPELKPCPFCGETQIAISDSIGLGFDYQEIYCSGNGYHRGCGANICLEGTVKDAERAWNHRPIEDSLKAEIERMQGLLEAEGEHAKQVEGELRAEITELNKDNFDLAEERDELKAENEWLITIVGDKDEYIADQQAEIDRLEEELDSHGPEGHNVTNEQFVALRAENERLKVADSENGATIEILKADLSAARERIERAWRLTEEGLQEFRGYPGPNVGQQLVLIALAKIEAALADKKAEE